MPRVWNRYVQNRWLIPFLVRRFIKIPPASAGGLFESWYYHDMSPKRIITCVAVFLLAFSYYRSLIVSNRVFFMSDEMYWISTSRVVHMLWKGDFKNSEWREYYGFANLNGAKFIYGIGLSVAGHTDTRITGVAPATYYRWTGFEPGYFPQSHTAYPLLRDARIISAFFTAMAVTLLYILVTLIRLPTAIALASALVLGIHPVTKHVATHAFSDGIFLFFQMLLLVSLFRERKKHRHPYRMQIITGIMLAYLVSVKINGAMFIPIMIFLTILHPHGYPKALSARELIAQLAVIAASALIALALLHPNFLFYPDYSPLQLLRDRVQITTDHVMYYSQINPSHVILRPMDRIASLVKHSFPVWLGAMCAIGTLMTFIRAGNKQQRNTPYLLYLAAGTVVSLSVLAYCVFDEPRYYLPVLPFISVLAGYSLIIIPEKFRL